MRIWDVAPERLCRKHLLGEHRELHAVWSILTNNKKGYARHPEVIRWKGRLKALYHRHEELCAELTKRGYKHNSPLDAELASGSGRQTEYVDPYEEQLRILKDKNCECDVE
ncbi:MAG: pyrimidine dimer DNA glycosylase/endonuclease V [Bacillota bacterium]